MRTCLRIGIGWALIAILLAAPLSAAAEAVQTPVTGRMYFISESAGDGNRNWLTGNWRMIFVHARYITQEFYFDASDDRLTGPATGTTHVEWRADAEGAPVFIHTYGPATIYDASGQVARWDCMTNGLIDQDGIYRADTVCHGAGEYKGLMAKLVMGPSHYDEALGLIYYELAGTILETGAP